MKASGTVVVTRSEISRLTVAATAVSRSVYAEHPMGVEICGPVTRHVSGSVSRVQIHSSAMDVLTTLVAVRSGRYCLLRCRISGLSRGCQL